jgi:hypothetical protein
MKNIIFISLLTTCLALAACSHQSAKHTKDITCGEKEECKIKWDKAYQWVEENSVWPVSTNTDNRIATKRLNVNKKSELLFEVKKESIDGRTVIHFSATCLPALPCSLSVSEAEKSFTEYLFN